eukprot:ctg_317.g222
MVSLVADKVSVIGHRVRQVHVPSGRLARSSVGSVLERVARRRSRHAPLRFASPRRHTTRVYARATASTPQPYDLRGRQHTSPAPVPLDDVVRHAAGLARHRRVVLVGGEQHRGAVASAHVLQHAHVQARDTSRVGGRHERGRRQVGADAGQARPAPGGRILAALADRDRGGTLRAQGERRYLRYRGERAQGEDPVSFMDQERLREDLRRAIGKRWREVLCDGGLPAHLELEYMVHKDAMAKDRSYLSKALDRM